MTDLVAGQVDAAFMVPGNVMPFVKAGRLKLIASSARSGVTDASKDACGHTFGEDASSIQIQGSRR